MYGKLKRLDTNGVVSGHPLRTEDITGHFEDPPTIGRGFRIIGAPITAGSIARMVTTSAVKEVQPLESSWVFQTENSRYSLTLMEEE